MKPDEPVFAELRGASTRPYSVYPIAYDLENPWNTSLPHLYAIRSICQRLAFQACAELAADQTDQALADVKLILALADSLKLEPLVTSQLSRASNFQLSIQPVWEGLAEHRWTDAQLQELQTRFLAFDFLADEVQVLKAERAECFLIADAVKRSASEIVGGDSPEDDCGSWTGLGLARLFSRLVPSGWYELEKANYGTALDAFMDGVVNPTSQTVSPHSLEWNLDKSRLYFPPGATSESDVGFLIHHRTLAAMQVVSTRYVPARGAAIPQTCANQAAVACALERYRLANGQFPETLDALAPRFIVRVPNDVIGGQTYKYRRTDDRQFILYSVGWDEKDDGGVPGKALFDLEHGDWVWAYPAK
jgi:hypothetical protein